MKKKLQKEKIKSLSDTQLMITNKFSGKKTLCKAFELLIKNTENIKFISIK